MDHAATDPASRRMCNCRTALACPALDVSPLSVIPPVVNPDRSTEQIDAAHQLRRCWEHLIVWACSSPWLIFHRAAKSNFRMCRAWMNMLTLPASYLVSIYKLFIAVVLWLSKQRS